MARSIWTAEEKAGLWREDLAPLKQMIADLKGEKDKRHLKDKDLSFLQMPLLSILVYRTLV